MNVDQLRYFVVATEFESFAQAARHLNVTPQAISKAIGDLERELGAPLFQRAGHGVRPTSSGAAASAHVDQALCCLIEARTAAQASEGERALDERLTVALARSPLSGDLLHPDELDPLLHDDLGIGLSLVCAARKACLAALEAGEVDAAIVPGEVYEAGICCVRLFLEPICVCVSATSRLAQRGSVRLRDLAGMPICAPDALPHERRSLNARMAAAARAPRYVAVPSNGLALSRFLEVQGGVAFVVDDPALDERVPRAARVPLAAGELAPLPLCLAYPSHGGHPAIQVLQHHLLALGLRRRHGHGATS